MSMLSKPWFLAVLALVMMLGTQYVALKMSWSELFPPPPKVTVIKRGDPSPLEWSFSSEEIDRLRDELNMRIAEVEAKEQELDLYQARLNSDRAEIEDVKNSVELMRQTLLSEVVKLESSEARNLKTLSKTYSTLEPAATVSIFSELDDATVVKILFFMKSDIVGSIFQEMATAGGQDGKLVQRAAKLSDMLRLFTDNTAEKKA
ncbi:hypothetical protein MLD52_04685 [Puniceicoccaceae bacterium K14]|nr:hypothetical protein [Puniceicoccaceae bacterium K14]